MQRISHRLLGIALSVFAVLSAGACHFLSAKYRETRVLEVAAGGPVVLDVQTANGSVKIKKVEGESIRVRASLALQTQERLDGTRVVAEKNEKGEFEVRVAWPEGGRRGNEGCGFVIEVPETKQVRVETSNGAIELSDARGAAELRTSNGKVTVLRLDGSLDAATSNGKIVVTDVTGDISARSSNGRIRIEAAGGAVSADTSNGGVEVKLAPASPGPINLQTSNGGVAVRVGPGFGGRVKLRTSNGSAKLEGAEEAEILSSSKKAVHFRLGDGERDSSVTTSNGSIRMEVGE
ncbi:MAG: DUF4097 family beta strand repeat-containing protein [Planctomycetota bacterium]|jgi:DUF4097 and DUF4098 domain-containing protein YvlB